MSDRSTWHESFAAPGADVPPRVRELADGAHLEAVWRNALGGLTFRATDVGDIRFIKYGPVDREVSMAGEAARLDWAGAHTPVPRVISHGIDGAHEWLVTAAQPGLSAVAPQWLDDPATAVRAIGRGLRALHDALPVTECPFEWGVGARITNAETRGVAVPEALRAAPPIDRLVVCHGDACAPNTLIGDDGEWNAHVDLGALGIADRWADIAVAAMSTGWNYGPGWQDALLEAYGIAPDPARMAYYQALWSAL